MTWFWYISQREIEIDRQTDKEADRDRQTEGKTEREREISNSPLREKLMNITISFGERCYMVQPKKIKVHRSISNSTFNNIHPPLLFFFFYQILSIKNVSIIHLFYYFGDPVMNQTFFFRYFPYKYLVIKWNKAIFSSFVHTTDLRTLKKLGGNAFLKMSTSFWQ